MSFCDDVNNAMPSAKVYIGSTVPEGSGSSGSCCIFHISGARLSMKSVGDMTFLCLTLLCRYTFGVKPCAVLNCVLILLYNSAILFTNSSLKFILASVSVIVQYGIES